MATPSTTDTSMLDVFVLTFNCAKAIIDPQIFGLHLRGALQCGNDESPPQCWPDLIVFALQEFAPLSYGFIGGYFLNAYYDPFVKALHMATAPGAYTLIRSQNVGMTAIMLFAKDPDAVLENKVADCAFGFKDMANKGAVGIRITYAHPGTSRLKTTDLTFVATHLAAMEWNLRRRNANWLSIVSSLVWDNPKDLVPEHHHIEEPGFKNVVESRGKTGDIPEGFSEEEKKALTQREANHKAMLPKHVDSLQNISVFKPGSHLFVAGDLNYRISLTTPKPDDKFPTLHNDDSEYAYPEYLKLDQLTLEREAGRTLHGMSEAPVTFPPTYKIVRYKNRAAASDAVNAQELAAHPNNPVVVPWKWAPHRWPGWCDRILYLDLPGWVKRRHDIPGIKITKYNSMPVLRSSDHRPVYLRAAVPLLTADEMGFPTSDEGDDLPDKEARDVRLKLPVPIDINAWERRARARKGEFMMGWTNLLWSTKQGALVLGTTVLVGLCSWWLYRGY